MAERPCVECFFGDVIMMLRSQGRTNRISIVAASLFIVVYLGLNPHSLVKACPGRPEGHTHPSQLLYYVSRTSLAVLDTTTCLLVLINSNLNF